MRALYFVLGIFCLGLGIIGAFLPVMPTTIFVILAAGCFAKCSPKIENRILDHPRFGPAVKSWRLNRSMSIKAKTAATSGMLFGALVVGFAHMSTGGKASCWALIGACMVYVLTRPTSKVEQEVSPPVEEKKSLRARIKVETRALHELLDSDPASLKILGKEAKVADYAAFLARTYGFQKPLEDELFSPRVDHLLGTLHSTRVRRAEGILDDLRKLGVSEEALASIPTMALPEPITSVGQAMGAFYVVEGSSMGGLVIAKMVGLNLGLTRDSGLGFLLPDEPRAIVQRFEAFAHELDTFPKCECDENEALKGATLAFEAVDRWFNEAPLMRFGL